MKKTILLSSLLLLSNSSLMAMQTNSSWFGGIDIGISKVSAIGNAGINTIELESSSLYEGLKFGKKFDSSRVYFNYNYYNSDQNSELNSFGLTYDFLIKEDAPFIPFLGLNLSYQQYEEKGLTTDYNKKSLDVSGLSYGINIGALYTINKNIDLELGTKINKLTGSDDVTYLSNNAEIDADLAIHSYLSVNYNF